MQRESDADPVAIPVGPAFGCAFIGALLLASQAVALTVKNDTDTEQPIMIREGDLVEEIVLAPREAVGGICISGCVVMLPGGESIELMGIETVTIGEDGVNISE